MKNPRPVFFIVLILITIASLVGVVTAQTHVCTSAEEKQSLREADTLRNWESLYKSYKLYKQCDDGAIAEGYSESVARILVDHWSRLDRLAAIAKTDVAFERFMMKHVDATLDIKISKR